MQPALALIARQIGLLFLIHPQGSCRNCHFFLSLHQVCRPVLFSVHGAVMVAGHQMNASGEKAFGAKDKFAERSDDGLIVTSFVGIASIVLVSPNVPFHAAWPLPPLPKGRWLTFPCHAPLYADYRLCALSFPNCCTSCAGCPSQCILRRPRTGPCPWTGRCLSPANSARLIHKFVEHFMPDHVCSYSEQGTLLLSSRQCFACMHA